MKTFLVHADLANPVLDHAAREITWMVEATTAYRVMVNEPARDSAITVQLKIMPELPRYTFKRLIPHISVGKGFELWTGFMKLREKNHRKRLGRYSQNSWHCLINMGQG